MTASPPAAPGMPTEEEIARAIYHAKPRNKPWDLLTHEFKNQYRKHARAILSLIRPAFEAKDAEIATFDAREEECLESMKVALENEEDAHRKLEAAEAKLAKAVEALEPFARADRALADEPGPFRFETRNGYRLIEREDFRRARSASAAARGEK
jgi:hypothetical protein